MYSLIKKILFQLSAEKAHHFALKSLHVGLKTPLLGSILRQQYTSPSNEQLTQQLFGLSFPNPVGLAAGFDKDAKYIDQLAELGFGFIEIGTITPKGQAGNPQPRLFRLPKDQALINRMGFNNDGMEAAIERLKNRKSSILVGGNIGKNKLTPNENAVDDYEKCFLSLFPHVDYFVVNVSSPNTPGLRALQDKKPLTTLLLHLQSLNQKKAIPKPILLKIAPDLTDSQLDDIIEIFETTNINGLIATNTTIDRSGLKTEQKSVDGIGNGGLSGQPLRERSTEVIRYLFEKSGRKMPIIGVGGIMNGADALEKLQAGACLVQIYTGFVYGGPATAKNINDYLVQQKWNV